MSNWRSLFYDDWRQCLRAHYEHVVRIQDQITEPTLRQVLLTIGLSEDEIEELRAEALATPLPIDDSSPEQAQLF